MKLFSVLVAVSAFAGLAKGQVQSACATGSTVSSALCNADDEAFELWRTGNDAVQKLFQKVSGLAGGFGFNTVTELTSMEAALSSSIYTAQNELESLKCLVPSQAAAFFSSVTQTIDEFTDMLTSLAKSSTAIRMVPGASGAVGLVVQQGVSALDSYADEISSFLQGFVGNYPCSGIDITTQSISDLNSSLERLNSELGISVSLVTGLSVQNCHDPSSEMSGACSSATMLEASATVSHITAPRGSQTAGFSSITTDISGVFASTATDDSTRLTSTSLKSSNHAVHSATTSAKASETIMPNDHTATRSFSSFDPSTGTPSPSVPLSSFGANTGTDSYTTVTAAVATGDGSQNLLSSKMVTGTSGTRTDSRRLDSASSAPTTTQNGVQTQSACLRAVIKQGSACDMKNDIFEAWNSANGLIASALNKVNSIASNTGLEVVTELTSSATELMTALDSAGSRLADIQCVTPSYAPILFQSIEKTISAFTGLLTSVQKRYNSLMTIPGVSNAIQMILEQGVSKLDAYLAQIASFLQAIPGNYACAAVAGVNDLISILNDALSSLSSMLDIRVPHVATIKITNCRDPTTLVSNVCESSVLSTVNPPNTRPITTSAGVGRSDTMTNSGVSIMRLISETKAGFVSSTATGSAADSQISGAPTRSASDTSYAQRLSSLGVATRENHAASSTAIVKSGSPEPSHLSKVIKSVSAASALVPQDSQSLDGFLSSSEALLPARSSGRFTELPTSTNLGLLSTPLKERSTKTASFPEKTAPNSQSQNKANGLTGSSALLHTQKLSQARSLPTASAREVSSANSNRSVHDTLGAKSTGIRRIEYSRSHSSSQVSRESHSHNLASPIIQTGSTSNRSPLKSERPLASSPSQQSNSISSSKLSKDSTKTRDVNINPFVDSSATKTANSSYARSEQPTETTSQRSTPASKHHTIVNANSNDYVHSSNGISTGIASRHNNKTSSANEAENNKSESSTEKPAPTVPSPSVYDSQALTSSTPASTFTGSFYMSSKPTGSFSSRSDRVSSSALSKPTNSAGKGVNEVNSAGETRKVSSRYSLALLCALTILV